MRIVGDRQLERDERAPQQTRQIGERGLEIHDHRACPKERLRVSRVSMRACTAIETPESTR